MEQTLKIFEQFTPNPHATKYVLSQDVLSKGKTTFNDSSEDVAPPLADALLEIEDVTQVHFFENVITITQKNMGSLGETILDTIRSHIDKHDPLFNESQAEEQQAGRAELSPDLQKIEDILDKQIRPALQMDGGDLDVVRWNADTHLLLVAYQGACGGCPSAAGGTMMAIRGILRDEFDPDIEVVADETAPSFG